MNATNPNAARKGWLLPITLSLLAACAVAAGVWFFLPPAKGMAYAKLLIRDKVDEIFERPDARNDSQLYLREQVVLLKSPLVLNAALNRPKVVEAKPSVVRDHLYPADWLAQQLKVDSLEGPQILRLSLQLDDPEEARVLVEAITDAYFEKIGNYEKNERGAFLKRLTDASIKHEHRLKEVRQAIKDLTNKNFGGVNPQTAAIRLELVMQQLRDTQSDLRKTRQELEDLQFDEAVQRRQNGVPALAVLPASYSCFGQGGAALCAILFALHSLLGQEAAVAVRVDPNISDLRGKIAEFEATMAEARKQLVQADDPVLRRLEEKLEDLRNQLRAIAEKSLRERMGAESALRQGRIARLKKKKEDLEEEYEALKKQASELNRDGLNLDDLRDDKDLEAKIANDLAERREKLAVDLDVPVRVSVLERARIEHVEDFPRRLRVSALAGLATLALVLLGFAFQRFLSGRRALGQQ
jgi:hypothetical protein